MWIADPVGGRCRIASIGGPVCMLATLWVSTSVVATATADGGTKVTVTGGADQSGHKYSWQVTNSHTSPIVCVEFPHYQAGLCIAPTGWSTEESTFVVHVGVKDQPGVCVGQATSPADAIASGESAEFGMQIAAKGARRGRGSVFVRFADGSETEVSGIELPQRAGVGERYVTLIGLGTIFAAMAIIRAYRTRRRWSRSSATTKHPQAES